MMAWWWAIHCECLSGWRKTSIVLVVKMTFMTKPFIYVSDTDNFVHSSLVHSTTQSSPDISRRNAFTRVAMQNLNQIWKSRIAISTKLKLYNNYLPVRLWVLGSHQERCTQDWCPRSVVFAKAVRNQMVPLSAVRRVETDNQATTPVGYCPTTASFPVQPLHWRQTKQMPRRS